MRILIQRVSHAKVSVDGKVTGQIGQGLLVLLGVTHTDTEKDADFLADKCVNLRIFNDADGKMNLSVKDINGGILAISQFTLYANAANGRRPGFSDAARPEAANTLYEYFVRKLKESNLAIGCGVFGADMDVELLNQGPVTILVESPGHE